MNGPLSYQAAQYLILTISAICTGTNQNVDSISAATIKKSFQLLVHMESLPLHQHE